MMQTGCRCKIKLNRKSLRFFRMGYPYAVKMKLDSFIQWFFMA